MAGGVNPILQLSGIVDANNALVINVASVVTNGGSGASAPSPIAQLPGVVDASNQLIVKVI